MTVQSALLQGVELLERAAVSSPRLTAEVLLSHALHCDRPWLYAHGDESMPERAWIHYGRYLNERLNGKPTQYITHRQEFFGREFYVNKDVLIPRPETEHLVEGALAWLKQWPGAVVLDVGTGSGAIAISVALEARLPVLASDISTAALEVARRNSRTLRAPVALFAGDLLTAVRPATLDLLLSNPPYVPGADAANMQREVRDWEPHVALFAGNTGLEIYQRIITGAAAVLKPHGCLMMELGFQSLESVRDMLQEGGWTEIRATSDLAGWPRVIQASRST